MQLEDVLIPLFIAALYFAAAFITASVILESLTSFRIALIVLIIAMLIYLGLRLLGQHTSDFLIGIQMALGFSLLTFGLIWWVIRTILELWDLWPFTSR
jgi:hypothetical protein